MNKGNLNKYVVMVAAGFLAGWLMCTKYQKPGTEVGETVYKERTVTKIIERKDGSKETTIVENKDGKSSYSIVLKKDWSIGVATSLTEKAPVYSLMVDRRILGDLFVGAYLRTDSEAGAYLKISF